MPTPKLDDSGNPVVGEDGQPVMIDDTISVTQEQYDTMLRNEGRIAAIDEHSTQFATPAPTAPVGPTPEEQLTTHLSGINGEIAALGKQIDEAIITGGKPVSDLMAQRDVLTERRVNLQTDHKLADVASQGLDTISQLTSRIVADKMPYLNVPEVKKGYDTTLAGMSAAQKASPDAHKIAYDLSCGQNVDKIHTIKIEEANRQQAGDPHVQGGSTGDAGTSRDPVIPTKGVDGDPTFLDYFGQDMTDKITAVGKTPDEWAKSMGYKDAQAYVSFAKEQEKEEGAIQ